MVRIGDTPRALSSDESPTPKSKSKEELSLHRIRQRTLSEPSQVTSPSSLKERRLSLGVECIESPFPATSEVIKNGDLIQLQRHVIHLALNGNIKEFEYALEYIPIHQKNRFFKPSQFRLALYPAIIQHEAFLKPFIRNCPKPYLKDDAKNRRLLSHLVSVECKPEEMENLVLAFPPEDRPSLFEYDADDGMSILHELIGKEFVSSEHFKAVFRVCPPSSLDNIFSSKDINEDNPLHRLLQEPHVTPELIRALLAGCPVKLKDELFKSNRENRSPLNILLSNPVVTKEHIHALLEGTSDRIRRHYFNPIGRAINPLEHLVKKDWVHPDLIEALYHFCPPRLVDSLSASNIHGVSPFEILQRQNITRENQILSLIYLARPDSRHPYTSLLLNFYLADHQFEKAKSLVKEELDSPLWGDFLRIVSRHPENRAFLWELGYEMISQKLDSEGESVLSLPMRIKDVLLPYLKPKMIQRVIGDTTAERSDDLLSERIDIEYTELGQDGGLYQNTNNFSMREAFLMMSNTSLSLIDWERGGQDNNYLISEVQIFLGQIPFYTLGLAACDESLAPLFVDYAKVMKEEQLRIVIPLLPEETWRALLGDVRDLEQQSSFLPFANGPQKHYFLERLDPMPEEFRNLHTKLFDLRKQFKIKDRKAALKLLSRVNSHLHRLPLVRQRIEQLERVVKRMKIGEFSPELSLLIDEKMTPVIKTLKKIEKELHLMGEKVKALQGASPSQDEYYDPITAQPMDDPVLIEPGHNILNRSTLALLNPPNINPFNRQPITSITPLPKLKEKIKGWLKNHPST